ncbi:hypothetical protein TNCV_2467741 [Trichonephila clavipes]|nr:hypothetical protein TNCV_2467741 [Trichonephila clavipes]
MSHSYTSAIGAAIAGNSSGTRFLECTSEDFPVLPEALQLKYVGFMTTLRYKDTFPRASVLELGSTEPLGIRRVSHITLRLTSFTDSERSPGKTERYGILDKSTKQSPMKILY